MKADSQLRRVQLTINNPSEHGYDHARIKERLAKLTSCTYWIMCDEIGGKDGTEHTHVYAVFRTPVRFSTIKRHFETAHIEKVVGSHQANIDYVKKCGKWADTDKGATSLPNTMEEWGERPQDSKGKDERLRILYQYIKDGLSNYEIMERCTDYIFNLEQIDRIRITLKQEEYKHEFRNISCIYVFGETNTNKTRTYMEKYGYDQVYRIINYNAIWDSYHGEDNVIFDEFRSQVYISEILTWTEGYPTSCLRARYHDKVACYTNVIFISNVPLEEQYKTVQEESPETWRAFLRRIQKVIHHRSKDDIITYNSVEEYLHRNETFHDMSDAEQMELPF